ncbi:MAG: gliding motility-associated C-terminal domain-containing protein [Chitinophagales bacterium]
MNRINLSFFVVFFIWHMTASNAQNTCSNPTAINSLPFAQTNLTTCGTGDDYTAALTCGSSYMNGEDYVFEYTATQSGCHLFNTYNTSNWTGLFVLDGCPDNSSTNCIDFSTSIDGDPTLSTDLINGTTYYIIVSTWPSPDCTGFDIYINSCIAGNDCTNPYIVNTVPFSAVGLSTCQVENTFGSGGACNSSYMGGNDFVIEFTAPTTDCYVIDITNTDSYTGAFVLSECPSSSSASCLASDTPGFGGNPTLQLELTAGETYTIVVSSQINPNSCTDFDIAINTSVCPEPEPTDCVNALHVCSSGLLNYNSNGAGQNDFASPFNNNGCLSLEHQAAWYSIQIGSGLNDGGSLAFIIDPAGGLGEDYDFAIYGPDVDCGNLGSPIRCSYADDACFYCPQTGLGNNATDVSEGSGGNGFVAPLDVLPGEVYYILVDNFESSSSGFNLTWTGDAVLDCSILPPCTFTAIAGDDYTICTTSPDFQLNASVTNPVAGISYTWTASPSGATNYLNNTSLLTPTLNTSSLPASFQGEIIYTLEVSDGVCSSFDNIVVTVIIPNTPPSGNTPIEYCVDSPVIPLTSIPANGGTIKWYNIDPSIITTAPIATGSTFTPSVGASPSDHIDNTSAGTTSFWITETLGNGCESLPFQIDVIFIAQPNLTPIPDQISCTDNFDLSSMVLTDINGLDVNTATVNFYNDNAGSIGNLIGSTVSTSGQYWVIVDLAGCTDTKSVQVTIGSVEFTITTIDATCGLQDGEATAIVTQGTTPYTYAWNTTPVQTTATAINLASGTYTVTVTDANDCTSVEQAIVSTPDIPDATANNDSPACEGTDIQLTATTTSTVANISYNWSGPNDFSSNLQNPILSNADISIAGTYYLTVTADGCPSTAASTEVVVYQQPDAIVNADIEVCEGTNIQLIGSTTSVAGDVSFQWTGPDSFNSPLQNPILINASPIQSGTYSLIVTANGCTSEAATTDITIQQNPDINNSIPPQSSCNGNFDLSTITITDTNSTSPSISYHSNNSGVVGAVLSSTNINNSGTYWIFAESNGCTDSVVVVVDIFDTPIADFTLSATELCADGSSEITVTFTGTVVDTNTATFNWDFGGGTVVTGTGEGPYTVSWLDAGTGTVNISLDIEENGCPSNTANQSLSLQNPLPPLVVNCSNSTTNSVTFDWADILGASSYDVSYTVNGATPAMTDNTINSGYQITGLTANDEVEITVTALNSGVCGNSNTVTVSCIADDCPILNPSIDILSVFCNDHAPINLTATPSGGTFSINGNGVSVFDPSIVTLETGHLITYNYTDPLTNCEYTATKNVVVYAVPTSDFTISAPTVCADGISEITITYTGTASSSANFNWDFGSAILLSGTGVGPYTLIWNNGTGTQNISLTVTQNSCVSTIHTESIELSEPLETPIVSCSEIGVNNINFDWQDITNAINYDVSYTVNGGSPINTNTFNSTFEVTGLLPDNTVQITVIAIGNPPCGNSGAGMTECTVLNCPPMDLNIVNLEEQYCIDASPFMLFATPSGGIFSGAGITGNQLNPSLAGIGNHIATYTVTETNGCEYSITAPYTIHPVPVPNFEITPFILCADGTSEATVTFIGTTYGDSTVFNWNFNGGTLVSGEGSGPLAVIWNNANGTANVSLSITENGCTSNTQTESIMLQSPLPAPNVICAETSSSSVSFEWQHITFAFGYEITYTINNGTPITISTLNAYFDVTDLEIGDIVNISVVPIGEEPCGNGLTGTAECVVEDCPELSVSIDNLSATYCNDEGIVFLQANPEGGIFSGTGVNGNEFDPTASSGGNVTIQYTYTDPITDCTYNTSESVMVIAVPTAIFEVTPNIICTDGNMEAVVTFTGIADLNATFHWDFGGGVATPTSGFGPYTVVWTNHQTPSGISLYIENQGCISETFSQEITLVEPMEAFEVDCIAATTNSVSFDWEDVENAQGYEISYSVNGAFTNNPLSIENSEFTVNDLAPQDTVQLFVTAIGTEPCGNVEATAMCVTNDCPELLLEITNFNALYCSNEPNFELSATPTGGIFIGEGIETNSFFNPATAMIGANNLEYQYTDSETGCIYQLPFEINVEAPLPVPLVNCLESTTNSITFNWNEVNTAVAYEITYSINNGSEIVTTVDSPPFEVTGLNPQDEVSISVVAIGEGVCGNSLASTANCIAQDCAAMEVSIDNVENSYCENMASFSLEASPSGGLFRINGTEYAYETAIFEPSVLGLGAHNIEYILTLGDCTYSTNVFVEINPLPTADFEIDAASICISNPSIVTYTGTANSTATYQWDFDGGISENIGQEMYRVQWNNEGTKNIQLQVTQNECISQISEQTIDVSEPLEAVNINCSNSTTSSVSFDWSEMTGFEFEVTYTVNGENLIMTTTTDNTFEVNDLNPQDEVELTVIVLNDGICGNSAAASETCIAQDCAVLELSIDNLDLEYCSDAETVTLEATPEGGDFYVNGSLSSTFDPASLGEGTHFVEYVLEQGDCTYSTDFSVEIVAPLEVPVVNCGQSTEHSVYFYWDSIEEALEYNVVYHINNQGAIETMLPDTFIEINDLSEWDEVDIEVVAIGNGLCGNSLAGLGHCMTFGCPEVSLNLPDAACLGEPIAFDLSSSFSEDIPYVWSTSDESVPQLEENGIFTINWNQAGWQFIYLNVEDENGCIAAVSDSVFVGDFYLQMVADTAIMYGTSIELQGFVEGFYRGDLTYLWSSSENEVLGCENCPNLFVTPQIPTTYTLWATDENGCTATTSVSVDLVYENQLVLANAFSPNGDGVNDVFQIRGLNIEAVELVIYNRWGNEVFRTQDVNTGWDGIYKNENQPIGTYAYYAVVRYEDGKEEVVMGNLTLVR